MIKNNKKIIIIISIIIVLLAILVLIISYKKNRIIDNNKLFTLVEDLNTDIYSTKKISDYIEKIDGKILNDKKINTEKLGEKDITFLYIKKKQKYRGKFQIKVVDKEAPLVWLTNSYRVKVGSDISLAEEIMCVDNYDKKPECRVEGEYDLNTVGDYSLTYVAVDTNKNEERVDFTLHVYENKNSSSSNSASNSNNEISGTAFSEILKNYKKEDNEIGIDVSKWQGEIDFSAVKEAGASFVMIRVGHQKGVGGEYVLDPYFEENIKNAIKQDLKVGIYFYSYADSNKEAKKQARWVLKQINKYKIELPVVFDWECYSNLNEMTLSLFGLNKVAESFLSEIERAGYEVMLYGSKNYLNAIWKYHSYNVWLAHYTDQTDYDSDYVMWQLCQDGLIDGIKGNVDVDILYNK